MKILLDENLPVKLKNRFSSFFEVYTVYDMKWNSLKNGELLKSINEKNFDALITIDKNIVYQHNLSKYTFKFVIIATSNNRYETLLPLIQLIEEKLSLSGDQIIHISKNNLP
jgi:predicted nuclease of predicted toxin-antitoxin system